jgi:hypothetical protein
MTLTDNQRQKLLESLKSYKRRYLTKKNEKLDESATRIMINSFLSEVLGFEELEEIRTEYCIRGSYADYVIQSNRKKHLIVEVKAISLNLTEQHLRQASGYGANEGIDWILLTNGREFQFYRLIFEKPVRLKKVFHIDLSDLDDLKRSVDSIGLFTKKGIEKGCLEDYWNRFKALDKESLSKHLYKIEVVRFLKKCLKQQTKLNFAEEDIFDSIHEIVTHPIELQKPRLKK